MRRLFLGLALVLAVAGCASSGHPTGVLRHFRPQAAAAVGARDIWILGQGNHLVRSTDGGAHFSRVAAPRLPTQGNTPALVFASARIGYAFAPGSRLYATHDGGASWRPMGPRAVRDVVVSDGYAYGWFGPASFERSPLGTDSWQSLSVPAGFQWFLSLAASGSDVWVLATPRGSLGSVRDRILRSTDRGATFDEREAPCIPGLGGTVVPAGEDLVWAVCPSGMMAGLWRSTDGGRTFPGARSFHDPGGVGLPLMTNGARIAPFSPRGAILDGGAEGRLYRTTDRGERWQRVRQPWKGTAEIEWLGFATQRVGYALTPEELWRTTDSGASWHAVPLG
jgi:photosystem II stability/assembly factor-like uncharacterized protein